tara:strand:+ start:1393 stop:2160 length:768 start_codon:yes stop_codon:yes gene_type:complete
MNYFFSIKTDKLKSKLTIPKFQNCGKKIKKNKVYKACIKNNTWNVSDPVFDQNNNFYFIDSSELNNENIFFLATEKELVKMKNTNFSKLDNISEFTDTFPDYRANLRLFNSEGGFSSYQSEYPHTMTEKKGSILSPISILLNKHNDENILFFKNIHCCPENKKFEIYFLNIVNKKIISNKTVYTNKTNIINIDKDLINPDVYLFSKEYLGIPIFLSIKNGHMSLEHTHPPHLYILGSERYKKVMELKKEILNVID